MGITHVSTFVCDPNSSLLTFSSAPHKIVNATKTESCTAKDKFKYLRVGIDDAKGVKLEQWFQPVVGCIEAARNGASGCLVHCTHGQSRSVSLVIAYLMLRHNMSFLEAFQAVKKKRCVAAPNTSFMSQLGGLEMRLNGRVSVDLEAYSQNGKVVSARRSPTEAASVGGCTPVPSATLRLTRPHPTQVSMATSRKGGRRKQQVSLPKGPTGLSGMTVTPAVRTAPERPAPEGANCVNARRIAGLRSLGQM